MSKITVELTREQAMAVVTALDATAVAGDSQDALSYYGSPQAVACAHRALEAVVRAVNERKNR